MRSFGEKLSKRQQNRLCFLAKNGDVVAKEKLILSVLGMVKELSIYYSKVSRVDFDDIFQEASIGFLVAIEKFDPAIGVKFSTYARYWALQRILRAIKANSNLETVDISAYEFPRKNRQQDIFFTNEYLRDILYCLDDKTRIFICLRYGILGHEVQNLRQISEVSGMTIEGVRVRISRGIEELRKNFRSVTERNFE